MAQPAHPTTAEKALRSYLAQRGLSPEHVTVKDGLQAMLDFFQSVSFSPQSEGDPDMLLFQWGVYDWGSGARYEVDITRQLIWPSQEDEEELELWQLSWTFRFEPNEQLRALGRGNRWCDGASGLAEFRKYVAEAPAFRAVAERADPQVQLRFGCAE